MLAETHQLTFRNSTEFFVKTQIKSELKSESLMCKEFETREKRGSFDMSILGETQLKIWHFEGRHFPSGTNTGQFFYFRTELT